MKLRKIEAGKYETLDGLIEVASDYNDENECECFICMRDGYSDNCPNGGVSVERGWILWDRAKDDYLAGTGPLYFKTKRDAVAFLERGY